MAFSYEDLARRAARTATTNALATADALASLTGHRRRRFGTRSPSTPRHLGPRRWLRRRPREAAGDCSRRLKARRSSPTTTPWLTLRPPPARAAAGTPQCEGPSERRGTAAAPRPAASCAPPASSPAVNAPAPRAGSLRDDRRRDRLRQHVVWNSTGEKYRRAMLQSTLLTVYGHVERGHHGRLADRAPDRGAVGRSLVICWAR